MTTLSRKEITDLLFNSGNGKGAAFDKLIHLVYQELRLWRQYAPRGRLACATAQINEALLRLVDYQRVRWQDRVHFFAVAAQFGV